MGKTFRSGHSFPSTAGFSGSTGKIKSISPYTRRVPKPSKMMGDVLSTSPKGQFARTTAPMPGTPLRKPKLNAPATAIDPGTAMQVGRTRKISQQDLLSGGSSPLRPGYKRGGPVEAC